MPYSVRASAYLERATLLRGRRTKPELYHSALELRSGIEARLGEYRDGDDTAREIHRKSEWKVSKLEKELHDAFKTDDRIVEFAVWPDSDVEALELFYYTPVTTRARKIAELLGGYLHRQEFHRDDHEYWPEFEQLVDEGIRLLRIAVMGNMTAPPIEAPDGSYRFVVSADEDRDLTWMTTNGRVLNMRVRHLDTMPALVFRKAEIINILRRDPRG